MQFSLRYFSTLLIVFGLMACDKEDQDDDQNNQEPNTSYGFISGEKGSKLIMDYPDGSSEEIGTGWFSGWNTGALLGNNYFRQLRIGTDEGTVDFRISVPEGTSFQDIVEDKHNLGPQLLLQNTTDLSDVYAELWINNPNSGFESWANGSVTIETSIDHNDLTYDIVGEIDAYFSSTGGAQYHLHGPFWSKDVD